MNIQKNLIILPFRGVAKVVSRIVRDDEIAGSSPVTSTKKAAENKLFWLVFGCFSIYFPQNRLFSVDHMFAYFLLFGGFSITFSQSFWKSLFFAFCDAIFEGWQIVFCQSSLFYHPDKLEFDYLQKYFGSNPSTRISFIISLNSFGSKSSLIQNTS